jgi:ribonuclease HI
MQREEVPTMLPKHITLFFDGACTKNPDGIATYGYTITEPNEEILISNSGEACRGVGSSCNVAEYHALTAALRYLESMNWNGELQIYGDSKLVICQLNGEWKCKKEHLQIYLTECHTILSKWNWTAEWIPREQNRNADFLSRS